MDLIRLNFLSGTKAELLTHTVVLIWEFSPIMITTAMMADDISNVVMWWTDQEKEAGNDNDDDDDDYDHDNVCNSHEF